MAEKILSQAEIEALLSGMAGEAEPAAAAAPTARTPAKPVKPYDFRRPDKFSKEHLRALRILFASFARSVTSSLTSYLRTSIQVRLTMVEQVTYDEYIRSLPSPTVLFIASLSPLPGQAVVEINLPVARSLVDRLLGGGGETSGLPKDLTEIEQAILKSLGNLLIASFRETWSSIVPLELTLQEPALSPEFVQVTLASETTIMLLFEVFAQPVSGTLSVCIPHPALQPILDKLTSLVWFTESSQRPVKEEDTSWRARDQLAPVSLPVAVELGRTRMTVRELMNLSEGQVIRLDTSAGGNLRVRIGEQLKFCGRPGTVGRNLAIQIVDAPDPRGVNRRDGDVLNP